MKKIKEMYYQHILNKNKENQKKRYEGKKQWFQASNAGNCYKKHWLQVNGYQKGDSPLEGSMKMELGNAIHRTIQEGLLWYCNKNNIPYLEEYLLEMPEINVRGHCDIIFPNYEYNNKIVTSVIDIKSMGVYPYRLRFGIAKNRRPSNGLTETQLGTYALMIISMREKGELLDGKHKINPLIMEALFYRKDDSACKQVLIEKKYIDIAKEYWQQVKWFMEEHDNPQEEPEVGMIGIPFQNWECDYCSFNNCCKGNLATKKK
jgi:hypothetical protein